VAEHYNVMISSTYVELEDYRAAVIQAAIAQDMFPLAMESDAALPQDLIEASWAKVDAADAYIGMISYRYGQTPECPIRNPHSLSLTELEFRRAQKNGLPICMFILHEDVPVKPSDLLKEHATLGKLAAFKALAKKGQITAEFKSVDDLKAKVTQSLTALHKLLGPPKSPAKPPPEKPATPTGIPTPPAFYAHPPYLPGSPFQGRTKELAALHDWANAADPVLVFEAIGGMGKSMVTWEWVTKHAPQDRPDWAGIFWYSFYERGADMRDFCVTALAYITGQPRDALAKQPHAETTADLLAHLAARPFLLVLDGLERVLIAYHRSDAAQLADDAVEDAEAEGDRTPTNCVRPDDGELLRQFRACTQSKFLMSSRLMPRELLSPAGTPPPGVRRHQLLGLDPRDAEQMLRDAGIRGTGERMQRYLERQFGCHPLIVGIVAGLVRNHFKAPGDFDQWENDPNGGASVDLTDKDIKQRRNHILKQAFDGLDKLTHALIARIAMISNAVGWDVLEALNPARHHPAHAANPGRWLNRALADLEARGLLQCDRHARKFDLHPVVRGYAVRSLDADSRAETGQQVAGYYASRPEPAFETAATVDELADVMQVVQALNAGGKVKEAWNALSGDLRVALTRLEWHYEILGLMRPLFPHGWNNPAEGIGAAGLVANEAAVALRAVGMRREADSQAVFSIRYTIKAGVSGNLSTCLRLHALTTSEQGEQARSERILALARATALAASDDAGVLWCDLFQIGDLTDRGALPEARALWIGLGQNLPDQVMRGGPLEAQAIHSEAWLLFREGALSRAKLAHALTRTRALGQPKFERWLLSLSGQHRLAQGDNAAAEAEFARAITIAHGANLSDTESEALRGLALARLPGRAADAAAAAASAERAPPYCALAELYLALGDRDKARPHALAGYKLAWAEGPPFTDHWHLEACRRVLRELGEPEPVLPPFDPTKIRPIEYEADVRRLLDEHAAKQNPKPK
jgi:tetratricopeptide (TPR) repeat protein